MTQDRIKAYPPAFGNRVALRELGLRDGLQLSGSWPETSAKFLWVQLARAAGVRHFELGSFLPARHFPQFADVSELVAMSKRLDGLHSAALTLNERAVDDALATNLSELVLVVSATEGHSLANVRRSRDSAIECIRYAKSRRQEVAGQPAINATISVAFGCPFEGNVRTATVIEIVERCLDAGAEVVSIADTIGVAGPKQVGRICTAVRQSLGDVPFAVHFHDTRGTAVANAYAALEAGVRILDGTIGGLGGCPYAPGASGNAVFEDLVYLCERTGIVTGIDLEKLFRVRTILESEMPGERLYGKLAPAGIPNGIAWQAESEPKFVEALATAN